MSDEKITNPFQPSGDSVELEPSERRVIHSPMVLSIQWTVVVLCNLIVPLLISWSMTSGEGKAGIGVAVGVALLIGYLGSVFAPLFVLFTTRGGLLVALSQAFPVLHMVAGLVSITCLNRIGILPDDAVMRDEPFGFAEAFFMTVLTGGILVSTACGLGLLLRLVTPDRWWLAKRSVED